MIRAIGYAIGFAIGFVKGVVLQLNNRDVSATDGKGRWGDLLDPPLPCGECNPDCDECLCLERLPDATDYYLRKYGLDGYTVDQLRHDIEELERQ